MTITRPLRRMTLHLSQIGLTLGLTFTVGPFGLQLGSSVGGVDHQELTQEMTYL